MNKLNDSNSLSQNKPTTSMAHKQELYRNFQTPNMCSEIVSGSLVRVDTKAGVFGRAEASSPPRLEEPVLSVHTQGNSTRL